MYSKISFLSFLLIAFLGSKDPLFAQADRGITLTPSGWKLWLDRNATWQNDELFVPPVDIAKLPVNEPGCGWAKLFVKSLPESEAKKIVANTDLAMNVSVPGTVEEFYWDALSGNKNGLGNSGDYIGVSWWGNEFTVLAKAKAKRVKLFFTGGIRQRAEIFVNQKLVGYELVHQTPFDVDITDVVNYGAVNKLAIRITDPGGNFSWGDYTAQEWGSYLFPLSHGFGGILGEVKLNVVDNIHVTDVFVKNKPSLKDVDAEIQIANQGDSRFKGTLSIDIVENWKHNAAVTNPKTVFSKNLGTFNVGAHGNSLSKITASVPTATLWGIRDANLYDFVVTLKDNTGNTVDRYKQRFGFRFLSVVGVDTNARYYFNGKRTLLISSISWGFWPTNGMFPTVELARRHIEAAQKIGQNMLNFHRCEGNSIVLNLADEMGMLYYEEPGGYSSSRTKPGNPLLTKLKNFDLAPQLNRERLLRMVLRDRNHPSLIQYNMVNEPGWNPDEQAKKDMADAHKLDPTRTISYGSGFMSPGIDQPQKLHMFPYSQDQKTVGYTDVHNAGNSPGVYMDNMYTSPSVFRGNERDEKEIFVWGEEGALASPPQLELIQNEIAKAGRNGWDGADYKEWYNAYVNYIKNKGLQQYYPSLTNLITSLGNIMYYEHGRMLENTRIADGADAYIFNGYEDMKFDNLSGSVDIFRHLKGDPNLISQYTRPLFVAVKAHDKIGEVGSSNLLDLYTINANAIPAGNYLVTANVLKPNGQTANIYSGQVHISGGDKFSDLVKANVSVLLDGGKGYYHVNAELKDMAGKKIADGHDEIFAVDWKTDQIGGKGAILGGGAELMHFAKDIKKANIVPYDDNLGKLDYVVLGSTDQGTAFKTISSSNFRAIDGKAYGLNLDYFHGANFREAIDHRISTAGIDFNLKSKPIPGYDILGETDFSLRWDGYLVPDVSGKTQFEFSFDDGARVWLDGKLVVDSWKNGPLKTQNFEADLVAGKPYHLKIEAYQNTGGWQIALKWKLPVSNKVIDINKLLKRVAEDGTKLVIVEGAEQWVNQLKQLKVMPDFKVFHPAKTWVGSSFFVRKHPFFEDLPVNGGMNWEYQKLVMYDGPNHFGLYDMDGEEAIVSLVGGASHLVSTSVGIVTYGKGKIAFSSLDLAPNLMNDDKASAVPKKIYCNYLKWASKPN